MDTDASGLSGEAHQLFEAAQRLPVPQQLMLANCILENAVASIDPAWKKAFDDEIAKRLTEMDNGTAQPHTWAEVQDRMFEALNMTGKVPKSFR